MATNKETFWFGIFRQSSRIASISYSCNSRWQCNLNWTKSRLNGPYWPTEYFVCINKSCKNMKTFECVDAWVLIVDYYFISWGRIEWAKQAYAKCQNQPAHWMRENKMIFRRFHIPPIQVKSISWESTQALTQDLNSISNNLWRIQICERISLNSLFVSKKNNIYIINCVKSLYAMPHASQIPVPWKMEVHRRWTTESGQVQVSGWDIAENWTENNNSIAIVPRRMHSLSSRWRRGGGIFLICFEYLIWNYFAYFLLLLVHCRYGMNECQFSIKPGEYIFRRTPSLGARVNKHPNAKRYLSCLAGCLNAWVGVWVRVLACLKGTNTQWTSCR